MIYSIRGKLIHIEPSFVVIECGGIGYKCMTTMNTQRTLPKLNSETMLYTHMSLRDDSAELFGFSTESELSCFRLLTSVSKAITRANGVGLKLAQRIILELKDKLKAFDISEESLPLESSGGGVQLYGNMQNAVEALAVLGYDGGEVIPILSKLDQSLSVEELISAVLREMASR